MNLCIKWLIQVALITGILCNMAYAADKIAAEAINVPEVVATVNGFKITGEDLEGRIAQSRAMDPARFDAMDLEKRKKAIIRTVNNMVVREVVYQEAVKRKIVVTDKEVDLRLADLKRKFPSEEVFKKTFADANMSIPSWKRETKKNLMATKLEEMMADGLPIRDSEIAEYYEKNKKDLNKDTKETLEDHREHVRFILKQGKWQQLRVEWLEGLLKSADVWKWTP